MSDLVQKCWFEGLEPHDFRLSGNPLRINAEANGSCHSNRGRTYEVLNVVTSYNCYYVSQYINFFSSRGDFFGQDSSAIGGHVHRLVR